MIYTSCIYIDTNAVVIYVYMFCLQTHTHLHYCGMVLAYISMNIHVYSVYTSQLREFYTTWLCSRGVCKKNTFANKIYIPINISVFDSVYMYHIRVYLVT